jgi:methionine-S-sulfoxide reductase
MDGVLDTEVAYANGHTENPTYEEVCSHTTGHAEVVKVVYDPERISLETLLEKLFDVIDPTLINRQGPDIGEQYRSGIYYTDPEDRERIDAFIEEKASAYDLPIATEVEPLEAYYPAEDYHQRYLEKNPNGYCHIPL